MLEPLTKLKAGSQMDILSAMGSVELLTCLIMNLNSNSLDRANGAVK